ncbi:MAG: VOC family protein [Acidobacteria bacterium]|nr:VOC family protein [Acidobacteriota bacterium]
MARDFFGTAPVLFVKDIERSVRYYVDVLGFREPQLWGDPPGFAMPDRDGMIVMLSRQDNHDLIQPKKQIWDMYFWVRDAKALLEEFSAKGAEVTQPLTYKEQYGNQEFIIRDPDGYTLAFGQETGDCPFYVDRESASGPGHWMQLNPVLASQDVRRDVSWYCDKLGFRMLFNSGDTPLNYAGIANAGLELHLQFQFPKDMTSTDLRIQVRQITDMFETCLQNGLVKPEALRRNTPWGTHEFGFFDPSGNRIHFYQDV